jgi:hypothetical protein
MRSITIGCTINIESFENLRVDVTDDDADRALALMCETLDRLGRSDPATSTAIDSYRQRVFGISDPVPVDAPALIPAPPDLVCSVCGHTATVLSADKKCQACLEFDEKERARADQKTILAPADAAVPAPVTKQAAGKPLICVECGVEITRVQRDVSQLFLNKDLCKPCQTRLGNDIKRKVPT